LQSARGSIGLRSGGRVRKLWSVTTCASTLMRPILTLLIAVVFATQGHAEDAEIASLFSDAGVEGTIVIENLDGNERYVHNETRAGRRFPAASPWDSSSRRLR
jgi:hypothetical protein